MFEMQYLNFYFSYFHLVLTFNEIYLEIILQEKNLIKRDSYVFKEIIAVAKNLTKESLNARQYRFQ